MFKSYSRIFLLLIIGIKAILTIEVVERRCDHLGVLFYEELGCEAVFKEDEVCPSSFKCQEYETTPEFCNFRGKKFKVQEQIPNSLTEPSCDAGCICSGSSGKATASCAVMDCPEWILGTGHFRRNCYMQYELGHCCSKGEVCAPYPDKTTCKSDGITYKAGEKFSPKGTCYNCVCKKGFVGKHEEPFCQPESCSFELKNSENIENFCAPVYFLNSETEAKCCPTIFVCPEDGDEIPKVKNGTNAGEEYCKFGKEGNIVTLGQSFEKNISHFGNPKKIKCICEVPPFLTCMPVL